jgi:hypothetical protein
MIMRLFIQPGRPGLPPPERRRDPFSLAVHPAAQPTVSQLGSKARAPACRHVLSLAPTKVLSRSIRVSEPRLTPALEAVGDRQLFSLVDPVRCDPGLRWLVGSQRAGPTGLCLAW